MKRIGLLTLLLVLFNDLHAVVDFGGVPYAIPYSSGCREDQDFFRIGFWVNFQTNNDYFEVHRSSDPSFGSWITIGGQIGGCGTCGSRLYEVDDLGPFSPGQVWYYRVRAVSNFGNNQHKEFGPVYTGNPTVINWTNQVAHQVVIGDSPTNESAYTWSAVANSKYGASISIMPTEVARIYLEQGNSKINFNSDDFSTFGKIQISINNQGYWWLYDGDFTNGFIWDDVSTYLSTLGEHHLNVKFYTINGTIFNREYNVSIVPKSDGLFMDNYCNNIRVWKGNDLQNGVPIFLCEGFDPYNLKSQQYYRKAGNELISCLLKKGFDVYVLNFRFNSQSLHKNAAVYQSAVRYISSISGNQKIIAAGMSMGGIVSRLACTKAENEGNPLPVSIYLSLDAPHQGAVISPELQDWQKARIPTSDLYKRHIIDNDAAKELLNYNTFDNTLHAPFYSYLNSLNGDGYPHLTENIAVSYSSTSPNPNSGVWLTIDAPGNSNDASFELSADEKLAGSFFPGISADPIPATSDQVDKQWLLSLARPFTSTSVTVTQLKNPTFIPHNSSLDLINGVSKFSKIIKTSSTGFHDVIPNDIIEPLVNALVKKNVYVQNKTYNNENRVIIAQEHIWVGSNVDPTQTTGVVTINNNSYVTFKSGGDVSIQPGGIIGTNYHILPLSTLACDGTIEFQNKNKKQTIAEKDEEIVIGQVFESDSKIKVYPNPTSSVVNVLIAGENPYSNYVLSSISGQVIDQGTFDSNKLMLDLSKYEEGVFLIQIQGKESPKTIRVVHKKH